jgi:hypothetical protein
MPISLAAILSSLKLMLPALEPLAQAQLDGYIKGVEAQIAASGSISPDWKMVETNLLAAVQLILDTEGAKLAAAV